MNNLPSTLVGLLDTDAWNLHNKVVAGASVFLGDHLAAAALQPVVPHRRLMECTVLCNENVEISTLVKQGNLHDSWH